MVDETLFWKDPNKEQKISISDTVSPVVA